METEIVTSKPDGLRVPLESEFEPLVT